MLASETTSYSVDRLVSSERHERHLLIIHTEYYANSIIHSALVIEMYENGTVQISFVTQLSPGRH